MKISQLIWQYVEDYDFYRIEYILDGYWHKIQLSGWNIDCDIPTFIAKSLRVQIDCTPEEKVYR